MDKIAELLKLEQKILKADLPLSESNLVFGEGDPNCKILFIGEAPGLNEDRLKRPFVGRSGKLLDQLIEGVGWKRSEVYITNIVKRRPPDNRDPSPEEIEAYKPYLSRQIDILNPKIIATLGRFSMNYFLPLAKITRDQGKVFEVDGRIIYPLFHPAAALRSTGNLNALRESFNRLPQILAKGVSDAVADNIPAMNAKKKPEIPQEKLF